MIDIHTHILPQMDDGSKSVEMSLQMLRMEWEQGVRTVVLTPHFYRDQESPERFFQRRDKAFKTLCAAIKAQSEPVPELALGAETAWVPNMDQWEELPQFCLGHTDYLLLEMPFYTWNDRMLQQIDRLADRGITPIFAHLERYVKMQKKEYIRMILDMDTPVQVSSAPLLKFSKRRTILRMLKGHQAQLVASDCHNVTTRQPNLGPGMAVIEKKLGAETVHTIDRISQALELQCESF